MRDKLWGSEPFWDLGNEWDPDWVLTDRPHEMRDARPTVDGRDEEGRPSAAASPRAVHDPDGTGATS
jgi:hypothetical protein